MSSKTSAALASPIHPPVGTLIDGGSLELVEVLGVGGYGVVYRAVDTRHMSCPKSYAVKCLVTSGHQTLRQRQIHIREIALHQIASAHPGVVTLHRVVEQLNHTYIIMDYAPDHDLFTQILHSCRYLGDDGLIKDVFLQLLDAVEYCHALGIYHRDLKPENILCFDDGLRVAITDFGLATTDKESDEFRTGSVYHMSPECQGGEYAPNGTYSPKSNDIWSLGIILLNLATGRNPWKSATPDDPTFQAYLRDPMGFLPTVLPISAQVNEILVRMLEVDFPDRMTLREVRYAIERVSSFYSDGVIFEGSMARCPWESGMDIDSASSDTNPYAIPSHSPAAHSTYIESVDPRLVSHWSKDSTSDIIFAAQYSAADSSYGALWTTYSSCGATWAFESPVSSDSDRDPYRMDLFNRSEAHSSSPSPETTLPATPNTVDMTYGSRIAKPEPRSGLLINTNVARPRIYEANASMTSYSDGTSMMHTAIEYDSYSSMFFLSSPASASKGVVIMPDSAVTNVGEDKEMISPSVWMSSSATQMSSPSTYSDSSRSASIDEDLRFTRSTNPSPEPYDWPMFRTQVQSPPQQCQISSSVSTAITDVLPPSRPSNSIFNPLKRKQGSSRNTTSTTSTTTRNTTASTPNKPKTLSRFAIKFFPRSSSPTSSPSAPTSSTSSGRLTAESPCSSFTRRETPSPRVEQATWSPSPVATPPTHYQQHQHHQESADTARCIPSHTPSHQQNPQSRSPRHHWFIPGRFRTSTGVN
ncbi:kinase-like protein [Phlegmacium glaucopus]|nr:kinase-like protein [Phlegmacium glaucopus]